MSNLLTYKISITCKINKHGCVIPIGSSNHIENVKGENIGMNNYPETAKIMNIWLGQYYQYPKLKQ